MGIHSFIHSTTSECFPGARNYLGNLCDEEVDLSWDVKIKRTPGLQKVKKGRAAGRGSSWHKDLVRAGGH